MAKSKQTVSQFRNQVAEESVADLPEAEADRFAPRSTGPLHETTTQAGVSAGYGGDPDWSKDEPWESDRVPQQTGGAQAQPTPPPTEAPEPAPEAVEAPEAEEEEAGGGLPGGGETVDALEAVGGRDSYTPTAVGVPETSALPAPTPVPASPATQAFEAQQAQAAADLREKTRAFESSPGNQVAIREGLATYKSR